MGELILEYFKSVVLSGSFMYPLIPGWARNSHNPLTLCGKIRTSSLLKFEVESALMEGIQTSEPELSWGLPLWPLGGLRHHG